MLNAQAGAARVLGAVWVQRQSLSAVLVPQLDALPQGQRGLAQEIVLGALRHYSTLEAGWASLLRKPRRALPAEVQALGIVGLYQLLHLNLASAVAVTQTVEAARLLGHEWACTLLNGSLRSFLRQPLDSNAWPEAIRWAHPPWLLERLQRAYPEGWPAIVAANNSHPPLGLRVNTQQLTRAAYAAQLRALGLEPVLPEGLPQAVLLPQSMPVAALPGFAQGQVSVQDIHAQYAAQLLQPQAGERILDACAAPGGKSLHVLEQQPALAQLVALDSDAKRLGLLLPGAQRLQLDTTRLHVQVGDAAHPAPVWSRPDFDAILLDAPCSATGVLRRHPDAKWLKRASDLPPLAQIQTQLLRTLWSLLKPGGRLLYVTCSLLPEENAERIASFLAAQPDAQAELITLPTGQRQGGGWQLLPRMGGGDGFFYALLRRSGAAKKAESPG